MSEIRNHGEPIATRLSNNPVVSTPIKGQYVTLERLDLSHVPLLFEGLGFPEENKNIDWITGFPYIYTPEDLSQHLCSYLSNNPDLSIWVIKANDSKLGPPSISESTSQTSVLGMMGYRLHPKSRVIKLDDFVFSRKLQNTYSSTEAHYLLLRHLFEEQEIAYQRVWCVINTENVKSRMHVERLGYKYEGTLRKDNITRWGTSRSSDCLSMLDDEWPENKNVLRGWLNAANFDVDGKQIKTRTEVRQMQLRCSL